jgi:hypothetical protein
MLLHERAEQKGQSDNHRAAIRMSTGERGRDPICRIAQNVFALIDNVGDLVDREESI